MPATLILIAAFIGSLAEGADFDAIVAKWKRDPAIEFRISAMEPLATDQLPESLIQHLRAARKVMPEIVRELGRSTTPWRPDASNGENPSTLPPELPAIRTLWLLLRSEAVVGLSEPTGQESSRAIALMLRLARHLTSQENLAASRVAARMVLDACTLAENAARYGVLDGQSAATIAESLAQFDQRLPLQTDRSLRAHLDVYIANLRSVLADPSGRENFPFDFPGDGGSKPLLPLKDLSASNFERDSALARRFMDEYSLAARAEDPQQSLARMDTVAASVKSGAHGVIAAGLLDSSLTYLSIVSWAQLELEVRSSLVSTEARMRRLAQGEVNPRDSRQDAGGDVIELVRIIEDAPVGQWPWSDSSPLPTELECARILSAPAVVAALDCVNRAVARESWRTAPVVRARTHGLLRADRALSRTLDLLEFQLRCDAARQDALAWEAHFAQYLLFAQRTVADGGVAAIIAALRSVERISAEEATLVLLQQIVPARRDQHLARIEGVVSAARIQVAAQAHSARGFIALELALTRHDVIDTLQFEPLRLRVLSTLNEVHDDEIALLALTWDYESGPPDPGLRAWLLKVLGIPEIEMGSIAPVIRAQESDEASLSQAVVEEMRGASHLRAQLAALESQITNALERIRASNRSP